jgi:hypothetical protein
VPLSGRARAKARLGPDVKLPHHAGLG